MPAELDLEQALKGGAALGQALKRIKEQLRALPEAGLGYGLLRYLNQETARIWRRWPARRSASIIWAASASLTPTEWGMAPEAETVLGEQYQFGVVAGP